MAGKDKKTYQIHVDGEGCKGKVTVTVLYGPKPSETEIIDIKYSDSIPPHAESGIEANIRKILKEGTFENFFKIPEKGAVEYHLRRMKREELEKS